MEAKDTVMSKEQIRQTLISMGSDEGSLTFAQRKLLQKQAEITFKAGIQALLDLCKEYPRETRCYAWIDFHKVSSQLKKWKIE